MIKVGIIKQQFATLLTIALVVGGSLTFTAYNIPRANMYIASRDLEEPNGSTLDEETLATMVNVNASASDTAGGNILIPEDPP